MPDPLEEAFDAEFGGGDTFQQHAAAAATEDAKPIGELFAAGVEAPPAEAEPQPEPQAEPVETEPTPSETLLAGKYTSVEELEKGFKALESKLGDGDYRALKDSHDQLAAQMQELQDAQAQQYTPPPGGQPDWLDETSFEKPGKARNIVVWAAQNEPWAYEDAMSMWHEVDPQAARAFENEVQRSEFERIIDEKLAPLNAVPDRLQADDQKAATQEAFAQAWADLKAQNPDLPDYEQRLMDEAQGVPWVDAVFKGADTQQMKGTLDLLLNAARQRRQAAATQTAAQQAEETQAAKAQGALTRATNTSQSTPTAPIDPLLEAFDRGLESLSPWTQSKAR